MFLFNTTGRLKYLSWRRWVVVPLLLLGVSAGTQHALIPPHPTHVCHSAHACTQRDDVGTDHLAGGGGGGFQQRSIY